MAKKKSKEQRKTVTLPIAAKMMYEPLAKIALRVQLESQNNVKSNPRKAKKRKQPIDSEKFIEEILQELGKDAFLYSFTPSGEIGSGDSDHRSNPQTPRIAKKFYSAFKDQIGYGGEEEGAVVKIFRTDNAPEAVIKNRLFRFKSSIVNLVQLFLECAMDEWGTNRLIQADGRIYDENGKRVPGIKSKFNKSKNTSFSYKKKDTDDEEEWMKYLLRVEMNRYIRLFVATFYMMVISDMFDTNINKMTKVIDKLNMAGINDLKTDKEKFMLLKDPDNRNEFVTKVRDAFAAKASIRSIKTPEKIKKVDQLEIDLFSKQDKDKK